MLDSLAQEAQHLELQRIGKGLTVDGSLMAQEGFQEVRAGLPSDAGAHLVAGTPSLGVIPPPLRPKLREGSLQVALGRTGAIPLLNRPSLHKELPVQAPRLLPLLLRIPVRSSQTSTQECRILPLPLPALPQLLPLSVESMLKWLCLWNLARSMSSPCGLSLLREEACSQCQVFCCLLFPTLKTMFHRLSQKLSR